MTRPTRKQTIKTRKRENILSGEPIGEQHGKWLNKSHYRLRGLEQQQNGEVKRHEDEQAADEGAYDPFA